MATGAGRGGLDGAAGFAATVGTDGFAAAAGEALGEDLAAAATWALGVVGSAGGVGVVVVGPSSLRSSTATSDLGVSIRSGADCPLRSAARSGSGGLTRRTRTGVLVSPVRPSCIAAPGESSIRRSLTIGPRLSTRTRMVRPLSSEVTST